MSFTMTVNAFADGEIIPSSYTCEGENVSPAIEWSGAPSGTRSYALMVDDPDAPGGTWTHWLLWDIPVSMHGLPEGYVPVRGVKAGLTDFRRARYGGPCPPLGDAPHRYFFRLFALDVEKLDLPKGATRTHLNGEVERHVVAKTHYMGKFGRAPAAAAGR